MKDMLKHLEHLRVEAAESELVRDLATAPNKRNLFNERHKVLAPELERAVASAQVTPAEPMIDPKA